MFIVTEYAALRQSLDFHHQNGTLCWTLLINLPALTALLELTRCGCLKGCSKQCKCKKISLACTHTSACSGDEYLNPFTAVVSSESYGDIRSDNEDAEEPYEPRHVISNNVVF